MWRGIICARELCVRTGPSDLGCGVLGRSVETNGCRQVSAGLTERRSDGATVRLCDCATAEVEGRSRSRVRSAECGVRRAECRVPSAECGVPSAECGVPSAECRVPSAECRVPSAECRVLSAECGVRSAECGVPSAERRVRSAQAEGATPDPARPRANSRSTSGRRGQRSNEPCSSDEPTWTSPNSRRMSAESSRGCSSRAVRVLLLGLEHVGRTATCSAPRFESSRNQIARR